MTGARPRPEAWRPDNRGLLLEADKRVRCRDAARRWPNPPRRTQTLEIIISMVLIVLPITLLGMSGLTLGAAGATIVMLGVSTAHRWIKWRLQTRYARPNRRAVTSHDQADKDHPETTSAMVRDLPPDTPGRLCRSKGGTLLFPTMFLHSTWADVVGLRHTPSRAVWFDFRGCSDHAGVPRLLQRAETP
ncbi:MAG: hypothetical protein AAGK98_11255 [Pseudomonadota bacterium]